MLTWYRRMRQLLLLLLLLLQVLAATDNSLHSCSCSSSMAAARAALPAGQAAQRVCYAGVTILNGHTSMWAAMP